MMTEQDKCLMLQRRAGFGPPLDEAEGGALFRELLDGLLRVQTPLPIEVVSEEEWQATKGRKKDMDPTEMAALRQKQKSFREQTGELGLLWMYRMVATAYPLQEKMALFWHGHFATRADNPYFDQLLLQQFREGALGNFGDLLRAVSKSPGMLKFLNNQQNKKKHPNENFAREVMELFTLGRGNYSEEDVKEAARAFTGWSFDEDGAFEFREGQHDAGVKHFLGKEGAFNGDDILNILLGQRATAVFVTRKLYCFFVNDDAVNEGHIAALANPFFESGYDVSALLRSIFSADWFCTGANRGAHIKSPVELLVAMQRTIPVQAEKDRSFTLLQRVLGQQLFYPPNVAGWPGGRAWIDASSLVVRMRLPEAFYASGELELRAKEVDAEMGDVNKKPIAPESARDGAFRIGGRMEADWSAYIAHWARYDELQLPRLLANFLLPVSITEEQLQTAVRYSNKNNKSDFIKTLSIRLMSLPEYQLA